MSTVLAITIAAILGLGAPVAAPATTGLSWQGSVVSYQQQPDTYGKG